MAQHLLASLVRSAVGGFGSLGAFLAVLCYQVDTIVPVTPGQPTPFERKPTTLDLTFTAETHNCDTPSGPPSLALHPPHAINLLHQRTPCRRWLPQRSATTACRPDRFGRAVPCGIAPYPGAETGTGGRIRDGHATGRGSLIGAATAAYCVGNLNIPGCGGLPALRLRRYG